MTSISQKIEREEPCGVAIGDSSNLLYFVGPRVNVYVGPFSREGFGT